MSTNIYMATFENVSVSAAQDFFELAPASQVPCVLHAIHLHNVGGTSDAGDSQMEMLRITVRRLSDVTSGSGGSSSNPRGASGLSDPTASCEVNNTTVATVATGVNHLLLSKGWNTLAPFDHIWTPETRPVIGWDLGNDFAARCVVRLEAAPADAFSVSGTLVWEEAR